MAKCGEESKTQIEKSGAELRRHQERCISAIGEPTTSTTKINKN